MITPRAPAISLSIAVGTCVVMGAALLSWRLATPAPLAAPFSPWTTARADSQREGGVAAVPKSRSAEPPDRALAATLRVDLFPPPAPEAAAVAAPPPRLDVELVAILVTAGAEGGEPVRRAFFYDPATQSYATLGVGDALRDGVTLTGLDDTAATLAVAHGGSTRALRMELKP